MLPDSLAMMPPGPLFAVAFAGGAAFTAFAVLAILAAARLGKAPKPPMPLARIEVREVDIEDILVAYDAMAAQRTHMSRYRLWTLIVTRYPEAADGSWEIQLAARTAVLVKVHQYINGEPPVDSAPKAP